MSVTLGQAYVQIMPSARGISGSIRNMLDPEATSAGTSAGRKLGGSMISSLGNVGDQLTNKITKPAMGAASVVSGIVTALGFKRLRGMDNAKAKLKGLGIEGEKLEIVMGNVKNAVSGTTHTMADGANVAAGALAAGVKEGADLERYIRLVGDAAIGANAPIDEMAQIFNRVQGTGKLMGNELNMIEYRLPGFSQALAKHLGVAPEEMRKMVSEGKVSADDFLNVMEEFAGGMSEAYAGTWDGIKDNVLANIGIIGEALLEGLFEDGKKGMAEFLEYLRSEDVRDWARETGETLREVGQKIYNTIKTLIDWWNNLSDTSKSAFKTLGGITVVAGPIIKVVTKIFNAFIKVKNVFSKILPRITPLLGGFRKLSSVFTVVRSLATVLAGAIGAISTPVLIVTGVITALVAAGVALWKNWDEVKEFAGKLWEYLVEGFTFVKDKLVEFFTETIPEAFSNFFEKIKDGYEAIKETIVNFFTETVPEAFNTFVEFVTELPEKVMSFLNKLFIEDIPYAVGYGIGFLISKAKEGFDKTVEFFRNLPGKVKEFVTQTIQNVTQFAIEMKDKAIEAGKNFLDRVIEFVKQLPGRIREFVSNIISAVVRMRNEMRQKAIEAGSNLLNNVVKFVKQLPGKVKDFLSRVVGNIIKFAKDAKSKAIESGKNILNGVYDNVKELPDKMLNLGKDVVTGLVKGIKNGVGKLVDAAKEMASKFTKGFQNAMQIKSPSRVSMRLMGYVMDGFTLTVAKQRDNVIDQAKTMIDDLKGLFSKKLTFDMEAKVGDIKDNLLNLKDRLSQSRLQLATAPTGAHDNTNVQIVIENMNVRDEQDIHKISRELQRIIDQNKRGRGFR